ncbi:MAG: porin family protein [Bacteroidia bacterium]
MKKFILLFLVSPLYLYSQKFSTFGLTAGYIRSQLIGDHYKGYDKQGFDVGVFSQLRIGKQADLKMELLLINKGCVDKGNKKLNKDYSTYFQTLYYMEMPILFQYNLKKVSFEAGPGLGILIWNLDFEHNTLKYLSRTPTFLETTFNLGVGYLYSDRLNINLRYSNSIIPIRTEPTSQYNSVFALSLYYKLMLRKV